MFKLRKYQAEALETVLAALQERPYVLLQAATGAGKGILLAELSRLLVGSYPEMRIAIIAHRQELIEQAYEKLLNVWPEGFHHIGLACASVGKVDTKKAVTIGSIQTLDRRDIEVPFDLLIIDECHHIPPIEAGGQYHNIINRNLENNPVLRVLGLTATPFRLNHGYIYGTECRENKTNFFPQLDYSISMNTLIDLGYLTGWRAKKPVDISDRLAKAIIKNGEYDMQWLSGEMSQEIHIESALDAYQRYGESSKKVVVFAIDIKHANLLASTFASKGYKAKALHSLLPQGERKGILRDFEEGELRFLVNVGILTEGWDSPRVDMIMMCRPTKSPGLFVQMIGRGMRPFPEKFSLLILDLAENFNLHGDPGNPNIKIKNKVVPSEPLYKVCPYCKSIIALSARTCYSCMRDLFLEKEKLRPELSPDLEEVSYQGLQDGRNKVYTWYLEPYVSKKHNKMARLLLICFPDGNIYHYLDFEGQGSTWGYFRARNLWRKYTMFPQKSIPKEVDEAIYRFSELEAPEYVTIETDENGFKKVKGW
jgi:DNA repair protein RadD